VDEWLFTDDALCMVHDLLCLQAKSQLLCMGVGKLGLGNSVLVKSVDWAVNSVEARRAKAHELK